MNESNRQRVQEITEQLEKGVSDIFKSEKYGEYLRTMSRFHKYSVNNTLLIAMQKPDASFVAGFKTWQSLGRHVKKGERGIKIIAPAPFKLKVSQEKTDPVTQEIVKGSDGSPVKEETQINMMSFRVVAVFDISQTEGKELVQIASRLNGNIKGYGDYIEAVKKNAPVPVEFIDIPGEANGFFDGKKIAVQKGMSESQTIKTLIHETSHAILHSAPGEKTRETKEVEAESVAYTVCSHFGIDTSEYSFGYIASWSSTKELRELRASLETIQKTASGLIMEIEKTMEEMKSKRIGYDENFQRNVSELSDALEDTRKMLDSLKEAVKVHNNDMQPDKAVETSELVFSEADEFTAGIKM